jgi:hypothetical protein
MVHRERRIQEIAYLLWERDGRPHGQSERFWHAAVAQFEVETAAATASSPEGKAAFSSAALPGPSFEGERTRPSTKKPAEGNAKATAKVERPVEKPKAATVKPKAAKPKSAKPKADEAPAVAAKASEGEPTVKSAKPKAGNRKPGT